MKCTFKLAVISAAFFLFLVMSDPASAEHGVVIKNQCSTPITYQVKWLSDSWSEPDIPGEECTLQPGEQKVHVHTSDNYSLQLTYNKKRRINTWSLDTYQGENFEDTKGYVFNDCGRSFCFNQEN